MPFVTEAIWRHLPEREGFLMVAAWPEAGAINEATESEINGVIEVIKAIRNIRAEFRLPAGTRVPATVVGRDTEIIAGHRRVIERLARVSELSSAATSAERPTESFHLITGQFEVYVPFAGLIDLDKERQRIAGEIAGVRKQTARVEQRLSSSGFVNKAPAEVVERERVRLVQLNDQSAKLHSRLEALG